MTSPKPTPGSSEGPRTTEPSAVPPRQREDQPLKEINDPPHNQKQAGQDLRNPQDQPDAK